VADPLETRYSTAYCEHTKFRRSKSNSLGGSGGSKIWGTLGPALWDGGFDDP